MTWSVQLRQCCRGILAQQRLREEQLLGSSSDDEGSSSDEEEEDDLDQDDHSRFESLPLDQLVAETIEQLGGFVGSGLYRRLSAINHSCAPNCSVEFVSWNAEVSLMATQAIPAGEELFITYCDEQLPVEERWAELAEYGFDCLCELCEASRTKRPTKRRRP